MSTATPDAGGSVDIRKFAGIVRVRAEDTGGAMTVIEHVLPEGLVAMPLHRHARETEITYVLEGTLTVLIGDRALRLGPGETMTKPVGVFHTFWNSGRNPARFLEISSPGGLERYYEELNAIIPARGGVPIARIMEISAAYGLEFDMSSLLDIIETHKVQLA
ncbi:MAG TPA: cupin domain-containing protein [Longimicrobium sp.]|nr:cupin domain-containing protein [Longimicrobium sp.]